MYHSIKAGRAMYQYPKQPEELERIVLKSGEWSHMVLEPGELCTIVLNSEEI